MLLYELLTGAPPFRSDDPLELIHWHIAGTPVAPVERRSRAFRRALSDVVMKLLAKAPEERYQSAAGLADDLRACAREWAQHRRIEPFALGRRDAGGQLRDLAPKLYGREREVQALLRRLRARLPRLRRARRCCSSKAIPASARPR